MGHHDYCLALSLYLLPLGGSVTSWWRSETRNKAVGGVEESAHKYWMGADVVYEVTPPEDQATRRAARLGLMLIREKDHDHLQPLDWAKG